MKTHTDLHNKATHDPPSACGFLARGMALVLLCAGLGVGCQRAEPRAEEKSASRGTSASSESQGASISDAARTPSPPSGEPARREEELDSAQVDEAPPARTSGVEGETDSSVAAEAERANELASTTVIHSKIDPASLDLGDEAARGAPADRWPTFRGSALGDGVSQSKLPEAPAVVWQREFENAGFEATCAIDRGVVYAPCLDGNLYALDLATGQDRWKFFSELGYIAAPAVDPDAVYIGDVNGRFYSLSRDDGALRWAFDTKAEIDGAAGFYQDKVLVGSQDATLYCLEAATGKLVWQFAIADQIRCTPTIVDNRCFLAGCDGKLHLVDLDTGQAAGEVDIESPTGCTPAVLGELAFFGTEGETVFAVRWKVPEVLWAYRRPARNFPFRSSAAATAEMVVLGGRDKLVRGLDPRTGEEKWTFATRARVDSSPVIVGDRAFVGSSDGRLYALRVASGEKTWEYECGGSLLASPAVAAGRLVIGNDDGVLFCFGEAP